MDVLEFAGHRIQAGAHRAPLPAPAIARAGRPSSPAGFGDPPATCPGESCLARRARTRA